MSWINLNHPDPGIRHSLRMEHDAAYRAGWEKRWAQGAEADRRREEAMAAALEGQHALGWKVGDHVMAPPHVIPGWRVGQVRELLEQGGTLVALVVFPLPLGCTDDWCEASWRTGVATLVAPPEGSLSEDGRGLLPAYREVLDQVATGVAAD